jgi:hypothetical protein
MTRSCLYMYVEKSMVCDAAFLRTSPIRFGCLPTPPVDSKAENWSTSRQNQANKQADLVILSLSRW